ncbi:MAG: DNA-binding protein [Candidatus Nezhaarchaeales archaeon]
MRSSVLMRFQLQFLRTIYNAEVVVVLLGGCSVEAVMSDDLILVRMDDGEELFENLEKVSEEYGLSSGIIVCALGMLRNVELGYFTYPREVGRYLLKQFSGPFEVVSFKGSLALRENKLVPHIHVVLANEEFKCLGGHLNKAEVNATLELFIHVPKKRFVRKLDQKTMLSILHFE